VILQRAQFYAVGAGKAAHHQIAVALRRNESDCFLEDLLFAVANDDFLVGGRHVSSQVVACHLTCTVFVRFTEGVWGLSGQGKSRSRYPMKKV